MATSISREPIGESEMIPRMYSIEKVPAQNMKMAIIVPVYAEYDNGNIFRLIESLNRQNVDPSEFEMILLVNNEPKESWLQTEEYQENQATLGLGSYLEGTVPLPEDLNDYRRTVMEKAKQKGLNIHIVDMSTDGFQRNIGKIRGCGLDIATERFLQTIKGESGIIAQLDADSVLGRGYLRKIISDFEDPDLETIFVELDYQVPEGTEELYKTTFHHRLEILRLQWRDILSGSNFAIGGPQIISRVSGYEKVGGIAPEDLNEDFFLASSLAHDTRYKYETEVCVYTADRERNVGYDSKTRSERLSKENNGYLEDFELVSPSVEYLKRELLYYAVNDADLFKDNNRLRERFMTYGIPYEEELFQRVFDNPYPEPLKVSLNTSVENVFNEYLARIQFPVIVGSEEWVEGSISEIRKRLTPEEESVLEEELRKGDLKESVRMNSNKRIITQVVSDAFSSGDEPSVVIDRAILNNKEREFIDRNPWLQSALLDAMKNGHSYDDAISFLEDKYPEYLGDYDESGLRRSSTRLRSLLRFVKIVKNDPVKFQTASEYLNRLKPSFH